MIRIPDGWSISCAEEAHREHIILSKNDSSHFIHGYGQSTEMALLSAISQIPKDTTGKLLPTPQPVMNPWRPMTDRLDLKHAGKLLEELGELTAALSRCVVQGIDECEPVTGKPNREWLEEEVADVRANLRLLSKHFNLDEAAIGRRKMRKETQLETWHKM